jgi:hypothetical protein
LCRPMESRIVGIPVFQFEEQRSKLDIRGKIYESA